VVDEDVLATIILRDEAVTQVVGIHRTRTRRNR
jgi:hypothetical protein